MDIKAEISQKYKKGNSILFNRDSQCCQKLLLLMEQQSHRTLTVWALDCAQLTLAKFKERYPHDERPRLALSMSWSWAQGKIKMPIAKKAILGAHAVAKEIDDKIYIALVHAIGHAGATVHVQTHAPGLVFYELTSIVQDLGIDECSPAITAKLDYYYNRLLYWQSNISALETTWANFLIDKEIDI